MGSTDWVRRDTDIVLWNPRVLGLPREDLHGFLGRLGMGREEERRGPK